MSTSNFCNVIDSGEEPRLFAVADSFLAMLCFCFSEEMSKIETTLYFKADCAFYERAVLANNDVYTVQLSSQIYAEVPSAPVHST